MTTPHQPAWTKDPTSQSHRLIAKFLLHQGYTQTLASFLAEATAAHPQTAPALFPESLASPLAGEPNLGALVDDWLAAKLATLALKPEPLVDEINALQVAQAKLPSKVGGAILEATTVLTVREAVWPERRWDAGEGRFISTFIPCILTTAVDRTLKAYSTKDHSLLASHQLTSPILSVAVHPSHPRLVFLATMSGALAVLDLVSRQTLASAHLHDKYIVKLAASPSGRYVASLGYDKKVVVYEVVELPPLEGDEPALLEGEERDALAGTPRVELRVAHERATRTNPEGAAFLPGSDFLVYSCRDDHLLHYLSMPGKEGKGGFESTTVNLNENGDSWVSFSVLSISLHPYLPILALQTSTLSARLLLYPFHSSLRLAILHTSAAQSEFFTPRHAWLPDGSAVAVNSEDGVVRIVDLQGKVRAAVGAHGGAAPWEAGGTEADAELDARQRARREAERGSSVIKDVWVGEAEDGRWRVWSVGFDKSCKELVAE